MNRDHMMGWAGAAALIAAEPDPYRKPVAPPRPARPALSVSAVAMRKMADLDPAKAHSLTLAEGAISGDHVTVTGYVGAEKARLIIGGNIPQEKTHIGVGVADIAPSDTKKGKVFTEVAIQKYAQEAGMRMLDALKKRDEADLARFYGQGAPRSASGLQMLMEAEVRRSLERDRCMQEQMNAVQRRMVDALHSLPSRLVFNPIPVVPEGNNRHRQLQVAMATPKNPCDSEGGEVDLARYMEEVERCRRQKVQMAALSAPGGSMGEDASGWPFPINCDPGFNGA